MGLNLDLVHMLGMPEEANCPYCGASNSLYFDDFDIESGKTPSRGVFTLTTECDDCEKEFEVVCQLLPPTVTTRVI